MNNRLLTRRHSAGSRATLVALLAMALPLIGMSQTAAAPKAADKEKDNSKEEVLVLSPFVVEADSNVGYAATSTLAGTRLNTNLRDLAAAITVITPELLADTNATSMEELLPFTPSTEIGGVNANFSAANMQDAAGRQDTTAVRREPQTGARVRGFATPNYTRGYFTTNVATDSYNIGSITISRGANALLFGLGSAGGVIESTPNHALIGRNNGSVSFRYGSQESTRTTLDYNATLIPERLALRLDLLNKNDNYQQKPAFDRENRVYAAINGVIFENKNSRFLGKTVVRGNFEAGEGDRTPPQSFAPTIAYDAFFEKPPYLQGYSGKDYEIGGGFADLTANWRKWAINDTRRIINTTGAIPYSSGWYESGAAARAVGRVDLEAQNHSSAHIHTEQFAVVFNGTGTTPNIGLNSSAISNIPGIATSSLVGLGAFQAAVPNLGTALQIGQGPLDQFINTRSYYEQQGSIGFKTPTLIDRNVFDYRNSLLTGSLEKVSRRFDNYSVTLEQSFFNNKAGLEATLANEFYRIDFQQPFGAGRNSPVYIDTTEWLPGGTKDSSGNNLTGIPNPNVGRAFMLNNFATHELWRSTYRDNKRVTGFVDYDFKDLSPTWGKWFGRHTLTGLWQNEDRVEQGLNYNYYWVGTNFDINRVVRNQTADASVRNLLQNQVIYAAYLSDDLRGKEYGQVRLNPMTFDAVRDGQTVNTTYYDRQTNSYKTGVMRATRLAAGATAGRTEVTSKALAWQARFLDNHVIGLAGWRNDRIKTYNRTRDVRSGANEILIESLAINSTPNLASDGRNYTEGDTFTWSVVGHMPRRVMQKLPSFISSLSGHLGVSENFQAIATRHDVNNEEIGSPQGTTREYGVTVGFSDDKWILRLNHFASSSKNAAVLGGITGTSVTEPTRPMNNYQAARNSNIAFNNLGNYNQLVAAGYTSYDQLFAALNNLIPKPARDIYNYQLENGTWRLAAGNPGIVGLTSTTDVESEGWEAELTANPTKQWRITLNAVQVEAVNSNSATPLEAFQAQYLKNLNDSKLGGLGEGPDSIVNMLGRYNQEDVAPLVAQRAKDGAVSQELRKYRLNLITNYDFANGWLKGFGVGGLVRWQSSVTIGYDAKLNSFGSQVPILDHPYEGPAEFNGDVWFSYRRKLTDRIEWKMQVNYRNLLGSTDDIPVAANPNGVFATYRIAPERAWYITNTLSF